VCSWWATNTVATATFGAAGQMLTLTHDSYSETRTYNSLLQLTRIAAGGAMDMQYIYTAGQNNGRIAAVADWMLGETANYTHDGLNRLSGASATNGAWGQGFAYDGFGNLTDKTVTAGSAPSLHVTFEGSQWIRLSSPCIPCEDR